MRRKPGEQAFKIRVDWPFNLNLNQIKSTFLAKMRWDHRGPAQGLVSQREQLNEGSHDLDVYPDSPKIRLNLKLSPSMIFQDAHKPYPLNKPQLSEILHSTIVQQAEEDDMIVFE